jgi:hypothetical protein
VSSKRKFENKVAVYKKRLFTSDLILHQENNLIKADGEGSAGSKQKVAELLRPKSTSECAHLIPPCAIAEAACPAITGTHAVLPSPILFEPTVINNHQRPGDDNFNQSVTNAGLPFLYHQWR